jgi:hypothetical protein
MDAPEASAGNTLYLPVNVPGALLYMGDGHAAMGDGEVAGTAIEVALLARVQVSLIKGKRINWPRFENDNSIMTVGAYRPLDDALRIAFTELVAWIHNDYGLSNLDAYELLSKVAKIHLDEMVDPNYVVVASIDKRPVGPNDYYIDPALSSQLVSSLVSLLQWASSPDAQEAQNIILRRIALQGDVVGSRIPPPLNISEVVCYINLLTALKQTDMRAQALTGALGVAGPNPPLGWISNSQPPLAFVTLINDRPIGPVQPTIPLTVSVRSDFAAPLQAALNLLHGQEPCSLFRPNRRGCQYPPLPLYRLQTRCPISAARLIWWPVRRLVDPTTDALALIAATSSGSPWQIGSLIPGSAAAANVWTWKCDAKRVTEARHLYLIAVVVHSPRRAQPLPVCGGRRPLRTGRACQTRPNT